MRAASQSEACPSPHLTPQLKREWLGWALGAAAVTAGVALALSLQVGAAFAVRWSVLAFLVLAYILLFTRRRLPANHPPEKEMVFATLGPGNRLTLLRGMLIAFLAGFAARPQQAGWLAWMPMALYTLSDVCDYFDGYLARRARHQTVLGEELDIEFDALGLLVAVTVAVCYAALPPWYLILGASRYAYLLANWSLRARGRDLRPLPPSASRRPIAGLTMGFTSAMLWPILPSAVTYIAAYVFAVPISFSFIRDWLVVSGILDSRSPGYAHLRAAAKRWLLGLFPLLLRPAAVVAGSLLTAMQLRDPIQFAQGTGELGLPTSPTLAALFVFLEAVGLVSIALGLAGRIGAFVLLFPLSLALAWQQPTPLTTALLVCALLILILGTGIWSLAKPEERIFGRRAGETV